MAPFSARRPSTESDGDSRRSSVRALNVSPQAADPLAVHRAAAEFDGLLGDPVELLVVDLDDPLEQVEVVAGVLGDATRARESLGKHDPPQPGPGRRNSSPMRLS